MQETISSLDRRIVKIVEFVDSEYAHQIRTFAFDWCIAIKLQACFDHRFDIDVNASTILK